MPFSNPHPKVATIVAPARVRPNAPESEEVIRTAMLAKSDAGYVNESE